MNKKTLSDIAKSAIAPFVFPFAFFLGCAILLWPVALSEYFFDRGNCVAGLAAGLLPYTSVYSIIHYRNRKKMRKLGFGA